MGKSTLLKLLAREYRRQGVCVVAFTTIPGDFEGHVDRVYYELPKFLEAVYAGRQWAVFVDESGSVTGSPKLLQDTAPLATQSRHLGHSVHFAAQRAPGMLPPIIRDQCERAYVFRVSKSDARDLANEYGHDEILAAAQFQRGEYLICEASRCEKRVLSLDSVYGR